MMSHTTTPVSSQVIDFVIHKANGLKGLVDSGLTTLPPQYIQPLEERLESLKITPSSSIPIIDVSNWDDPQVQDSIFQAATQLGFFQIINHGIPNQVLDKVIDSAHAFYSLPNDERRVYWKGNSPSATVFYTTSFSPFAEKVLEWKDFLMFQYVSGDEDASSLWPPVCKDQVLDYMKRAEPVIKKLVELLLKKINVKDVIDKERESCLMGSPRISLNYYPECPNPELAAGVGRHSDISTITILLQDDTGGLYVKGEEEEEEGHSWIPVPPVEGALVVNVGDVLQIMSNDLYKSVEHRAFPSKTSNRVSVPIFINPAPDAVIGVLPEVLESGAKAVYKPIMYSDYFMHFFSKGHDGKTSLDFAKI
ncbi:Feruloyl CoA ortho-hydroxylase F6H1-3 [Linum perenne]